MQNTLTQTGIVKTYGSQQGGFELLSVSEVLGRMLPGLGLDEAKAEQISRAYELAERIKACPGCGYDDMDGRISVDVGDGEHIFVRCPLQSPQCRYGQVLYERIDRASVEYVKAIPGLPRRFFPDLGEPKHTAAIKGVNRWLLKLEQRCFLVLFGGHGSGKSFGAAYALCGLDRRRLLTDWDKPYKWTHIKALWASAYRVASEDEVFKAAQSVPVLVVDDLGSEESTARARGRIAEVVSERYNNAFLTVFTSNDDMQSFEKTYGRRMCDRMLSVGEAVSCDGESLRLS